jgi:uncharacterized protein YdaU (DUF1376 family)
MHYYKKNIGDYAKKTGRLSMLQHGAYTLLIDSCYDREKFPTLEEAIEWSWAITKDEIDAVEFVLKRFFTFENGVYVQSRIQEEIIEYHSKANKNKEIAIQREAKRRGESTKRERIVNETPPNQEPITNNHKPKIITPEGVSESLFKDYLEVRKGKKAKWTETAYKGLQREADKAKMTLSEVMQMCCERGWVGFKAEWVKEEAIKQKQLPLATNEQIEEAYRVECGKDPKLARFGSYYEMREYVIKQRELRFRTQA